MRKIIAVAALLLLGACQAAGVAIQTFSPVEAQKAAYAARTAYTAALVAAVAYNELPRCERPAAPVVCSKQEVVVQLRQASAAADAATLAAENAVRSLSANPTVVGAAITAATQAVGAMKAITAAYVK